VNSSEFLTFDLGVPTDPQNFIMTGRRNTPIQLTSSGTYTLQANPTDAWTSPAFSTTLTYNDEVISKLSVTGLAGTKFRYWRVLFDDLDNPNGFLELSSLFLGNAFGEDTRGRVQFPFTSRFEDLSRTLTSDGGSTHSNLKEKTQSFSARWFPLAKAELEDLEDIFDEFGTSSAFFISMDSDKVFSTNENKRIVYAKMTGPPAWTLERPDIFSATMTFKEEI